MPAGTQIIAVEFSFDPASEARLTAIWSLLDRKHVKRGVSESGVRPHVSLAVFREGGPSNLDGLVASFAAHLRPFSLHLARVAAFRTNEGVVFLEPATSSELVSAHRALMTMLGDDQLLVQPYYREDAWVPHCTVAIGVSEDEVDRIIDACHSADALGPVTVRRVSVVQYRPTIELHAFEIKTEEGRAWSA